MEKNKKKYNFSGFCSKASTLLLGIVVALCVTTVPVFASNDTFSTEVVFVSGGSSNILNPSGSFNILNTGVAKNLEYYTESVFDTTQTATNKGSLVCGVEYSKPYQVNFNISGFVKDFAYSGVLSSGINLGFSPNFTYSGWNVLGSTLDFWATDLPIEINLKYVGTFLTFDLYFNDFIPWTTGTISFTVYFTINVTARTTNFNSMVPVWSAMNGSNIDTTFNTASWSSNSFSGEVTATNATDLMIANFNDLRQRTMIDYLSAISTYNNLIYGTLSSFYSSELVQFNDLSNRLDRHNTALLNNLNQNFSMIHHDITDNNDETDEKNEDTNSAMNDAFSAESDFTDYYSNDDIKDYFDDTFTDDITEGSSFRFWFDFNNHFFNEMQDNDANRPIFIKIFLNMLGRLW